MAKIMVLCKSHALLARWKNWLGTFYPGGLRFGNLCESFDENGDFTR